ncbi:MAG: hypothetical protein GY756_12930 [bacterium]|nr:hypothetical protein [bacterium]
MINYSCETERYTNLEMPNGPYLGQQLPANEPLQFFSELFGQAKGEFGQIFSIDGKEMYYSRQIGLTATFSLLYMKMNDDGSWTEPALMHFSGVYNEANPHLANDDNRLYFTSKRPLNANDTEEREALDIWYVDRIDDGWSDPINVGAPVNLPDSREDYPFIHGDKLYFQSDRALVDNEGARDMYCADIVDGAFTNVQNLGDSINTPRYEESNLIITQDDVLFYTSERFGIQDIYYTTMDNDGVWKNSRNIGPPINTIFMDGQPKVTPDNLYFFFSRRQGADRRTYWVRLDYVYSLMEN